MKILFISKYACPPTYGFGSRLIYLAKYLGKSGHDLRLITSDANHSAFNWPNSKRTFNDIYIDGCNMLWIKTRKYKKTTSIDRILSWIDFELKVFYLLFIKRYFLKPDIVVVSSLSFFSIINGLLYKMLFKTKLVFEVRDIWPLTLTEEGSFSSFNPLIIILRAIELAGYRFSDLVVGTMPGLKKHVSIGGLNKRVICIPIGYDEIPENKDIDFNFLKNSNFNPNKITIAYAGSIGITNALDNFIEAIKLNKNDNVQFVIIGDGDLKEKYKRKLSSQNNIIFGPRIDNKDVPSLLSLCDILYLSTFPSKVWEYGQSLNKMVEYMLAGKPIIASYSGLESMLNEAKCGVFVRTDTPSDLVNAINDYAKLSKTNLEEIGKKGREWVISNRHYSKLSNQYENELQNLLNNDQ